MIEIVERERERVCVILEERARVIEKETERAVARERERGKWMQPGSVGEDLEEWI